MKENEAIKIIEQEMKRESKKSTIKAFEIALKALEEVQRYRGTGAPEGCGSTPEKCRKALEKQSVSEGPKKIMEQLKKVAFERYGNDGMGGEMVVDLEDAVEIVGEECFKYCGHCYRADECYPNCGQRLDWSTDTVADQENTEARNTSGRSIDSAMKLQKMLERKRKL